VFGFLVDQSGTYRFAWLVLAGVGALSLVAVRQVTEESVTGKGFTPSTES
jgi:hypothetical protein